MDGALLSQWIKSSNLIYYFSCDLSKEIKIKKMEGRAEFKLQCIKLKWIVQAILSYDIRKNSKSWVLYLGYQNRWKMNIWLQMRKLIPSTFEVSAPFVLLQKLSGIVSSLNQNQKPSKIVFIAQNVYKTCENQQEIRDSSVSLLRLQFFPMKWWFFFFCWPHGFIVVPDYSGMYLCGKA